MGLRWTQYESVLIAKLFWSSELIEVKRHLPFHRSESREQAPRNPTTRKLSNNESIDQRTSKFPQWVQTDPKQLRFIRCDTSEISNGSYLVQFLSVACIEQPRDQNKRRKKQRVFQSKSNPIVNQFENVNSGMCFYQEVLHKPQACRCQTMQPGVQPRRPLLTLNIWVFGDSTLDCKVRCCLESRKICFTKLTYRKIGGRSPSFAIL